MNATAAMLQNRIETTLAVPGEQAVIVGNQAVIMQALSDLLILATPAKAGVPTAMQDAIDTGLFDEHPESNRTPATISRVSRLWEVAFEIGQSACRVAAKSKDLDTALRGAVVNMIRMTEEEKQCSQ